MTPLPVVASADRVIAFGPFRLVPAQQLLLEGDRPVRLGSRAFDLLMMLVERPGELVPKQALLDRVWPDTFVEDSNLKVHVSALRRALGDGQAGRRYLANVPGRGYRFVAQVDVIDEGSPDAAPVAEQANPIHNLPPLLIRMIGRAPLVARLGSDLARQRLVTIVGPGGIGKTTLAMAVAETLLGAYRDGVHLLDLAPVSDESIVAGRLASLLGLDVRSNEPSLRLLAHLADKHMLIVIDNCEHLIETAAGLIETLLKAAPRIHVLATSREALRIDGERVQRMQPLDAPKRTDGLKAAEALDYPAVHLFVERVAACIDGFILRDADAPIAGEICRRLDGVPLAIELAAGRVDAFGLRGVLALLDDRFQLLKSGRRTALSRHRAMSAVLDWSYELLPEIERLVLRRLAIFAGDFLLESASKVIGGQEIAACDVVDGMANLVTKSLLSADIGGPVVRYRLLETTRAYALAKLKTSDEHQALAGRHARHFRDLLEDASAAWDTRPTDDWLLAYAHQIDNARAALDWAFSPDGEVEIGIGLTIAAAPLWFQLSLINEGRGRVHQAIAAAESCDTRCVRRDMQLYAALGWSEMYVSGDIRETGGAWRKALELAEAEGDVDFRLRALWGLWAGKINNGAFREALELAARFRDLSSATSDATDGLVGERMMAQSLHFLGRQTEARAAIDHMLDHYAPPANRSHIVRFQFDQRVTARITQTRVLWLLGLPDQAMQALRMMIDEALSLGHGLSLCNSLAQAACPVALLAGDLDEAKRCSETLLRLTEQHALDLWEAYGRLYQGAIMMAQGEIASGFGHIRDAAAELEAAHFNQYRTAFLSILAAAAAAAGETDQAADAIDAALAQCARTDEGWCLPELLRQKGELTLQGSAADDAEAETFFRQSLDLARAQGALSWELRSATSLAKLLRQRGDKLAARDALAPVYARFTEGFGTADLRLAKDLLGTLG